MNKIIFLFFVCCLGMSGVTLGQTLMAGKILDENDKPVPGALLKITNRRTQEVQDVRADDNGLYYSRLLQPGYYRVDISAGDKYYKARRIYFASGVGKYYIFKISGEKLGWHIEDHDPFAAACLEKVENKPLRNEIILDGKRGMRNPKRRVTGTDYPLADEIYLSAPAKTVPAK